MDLEQKQLVIRIGFFLLGAVGIALLAKRKTQNPWLWGGVGGVAGFFLPLLIIVPLLIVGFLKYRCPKCGTSISNQEAKDRKCPKCDSTAATAAV